MTSPSIFYIAGTCVAATLALSACVVAPYPQQQVVYPQNEPGGPEVVVGLAPPAPYVEVIPAAPFLGALWISGYWGWSQGRHQWVPGRHVQPRPGHRWEPHHWAQGPRGNWHLRGGRWTR